MGTSASKFTDTLPSWGTTTRLGRARSGLVAAPAAIATTAAATRARNGALALQGIVCEDQLGHAAGDRSGAGRQEIRYVSGGPAA